MILEVIPKTGVKYNKNRLLREVKDTLKEINENLLFQRTYTDFSVNKVVVMGEKILINFNAVSEFKEVCNSFGLLNANPKKRKGISKKVEEDSLNRNSIALTPLAMPMLAGPGSISLLIAFYQDHNSTTDILASSLSILTVSLLIFLILRSAHYLAKYLGASGIVAISRIVGFLTVAIGIQYIISAILSIIRGI